VSGVRSLCVSPGRLKQAEGEQQKTSHCGTRIDRSSVQAGDW
jgi:hypothetical protein